MKEQELPRNLWTSLGDVNEWDMNEWISAEGDMNEKETMAHLRGAPRPPCSVFLLLFRKGKKNRRPSGGDFFEDGNTGIYVVFNTLSAPQAKILLSIRRFKHFPFNF